MAASPYVLNDARISDEAAAAGAAARYIQINT